MRHPDCHCPRTAHAHGQYATYIRHRCRCDDCRTARRNQERWRRRAKAYGRYDHLVDAEPVRAHIRSLMAAGMGPKTIASAGGWRGSGTIAAIVYGKWADQPDHPEHRPPRKQVTRQVAERILAIQPALRPGARVEARGTTRRLQALVARGYSLLRISTELGIEHLAVWRLTHGYADRCLESTRVAVADLFDRWADTPPPSATGNQGGSVLRAQRFAARHGWVVAASWDDIDLDDAPSVGDAPRRPRRGKASDIHPDDIDLMLRTNTTSHEAAARLGITRGYLLELAGRHGVTIPAHIRVGDQERAQLNRERRVA